jgi:hypothetical protein
MLRHDYSQLAVLSGSRDLRGAVSWESIAQSRIRSPSAVLLKEAIIPSILVELDEDVLTLIPRIVEAGFVFVQRVDHTLSGIVTMADLSLEFYNLATPFFLLGEIERRLRRVIDEKYTPGEIAAIRDPTEPIRDLRSADDLTFGQYERLLEEPGRWERLGWAIDRRVFVGALGGVRTIRNDVMHFGSDPFDEDQLDELRNFVKWLRVMDPWP